MLNKYQILDFFSIFIELYLGYYLYKDNKKHLTLELIFTIDFNEILVDILKMIAVSFSSIFLMISMYLCYSKLFIVLICLSLLCISYFNIFYVVLLGCLTLYDDDYRRDFRVLDLIFSKFSVLVYYSLYNLLGLFISITVLKLVLNINYKGFKLLVFVFMNALMAFNVIKKISVNVILLLFRSNIGYLENILIRTISKGNTSMASLMKFFSFLYISPNLENYIVMYSILNNTSYFESVTNLKKIRIRYEIKIRWILYPYTAVMVYVVETFLILKFFGDYEKFLFFLDIHIFYIELYFNILAYYNLLDSIEEEKVEL
ncbi:hypothetical protein P3W45_000258 [Vairimorpha bombi]|jgi:hypothetical protein